MAESKPNRRDFLRGRAVLDAAADAISSAIDHHMGPLEPTPLREPAGEYLTLTRRAMACDFEIRFNAEPGGDATAAAMEAFDEVERVENRLTVYRQASDLIDLNHCAANEPAPLDNELWSLMQLIDRWHQATHGAFDPTSGPLSRVWGFHQRQGALPDEEQLAEAMDRVGWDRVELDSNEQSIRFRAAGLELNANSFGKGYALDRAGEKLADCGVADSLMHGGRSTLVARGDDRWLVGGGWRVGLRDPLQPERRLAELRLRDEALSTSGQGTQFFEHEGRKLGHVLDPRTGWPAEGLYSATVIAPTGAEADALSTALCVLGVEESATFCATRPEIKALVVAPSREGKTEVHAFNLGDEWRPSA